MEIVYLVEIAIFVTCAIIGAVYLIWKRYAAGARLAKMEKKVTEYCAEEGYECKKEDGILNVKCRGVYFRIFLNGKEDLQSTSLWVQYATHLDEDLSTLYWTGQTVLVNVLNHKHPSLNVSLDLNDHILWAHYRADIRSQEEFAFHFNGAYNEMKSLMSDCSELLPQLRADFPPQPKQQTTIGFK